MIKNPISGISKNVIFLGLVSFFNDVASEMVYPIIPIFLTGVLGAPVAVVGLIEGIAESTSSAVKVLFGWLSDKMKNRKTFTVSGYALSAISKALLSLAYAWPAVLFARFLDRFGKGVRTSSRDALISESTDLSSRGKAFGFHRGLDTLGAVVGPLFALIAINYFNNNFRMIFFLAFIPAVIGVMLLILFVKEKSREKEVAPLKIELEDPGHSFNIFLFVSLIFALGNSSDAFLILRAQNLGLSLSLIILTYVSYNVTYAVFSMPAGIVFDRVGPKNLIVSGFLLFALVYSCFGIINNSIFLWLLFPLYGIYMALTDGVSKAYISFLVTNDKIGTAFGIYNTSTGLCTFFASLIAGLLWTFYGPSSPFLFGGIIAVVAAILFFLLKPDEITSL